MKMVFLGDGPWACRALPDLANLDGASVELVVGRHPRWDLTLERIASELGLSFTAVPNVNAPGFLAELSDVAADLHVSMSHDQIFRAAFLASARLGAINCHAGALPFYRGRNVLNWAIINGETEFGVTVHHVDEGIDTGDIILQRRVPIGPDDTYADVLAAAEAACADALADAVRNLRDGTAVRTPQASIHPVGFYCGRRRPGDEWCDWTADSRSVHDFVRGIAPPGPGARTLIDGHEFALLRTTPIPEAPRYIGIPGEIVGRDSMGVVVKTGDSTIRVCEVARVVDGEVAASETPVWPIGTRLTRGER